MSTGPAMPDPISPGPDASSWEELNSRPTPEWFRSSPFGIFIHWGAYSVAAWAEPIGALGTVEDDVYWFTHNPYAEWYHNTIRIEGSPAQQHHQEAFGGAPYDDLLDQWNAEKFDPADWADLFATAGADYVVPTTKHHDGIALWDAPGTGMRNTVHRGPQQDLIAAIGDAVRARGIRLGVYYSGGLDWHVRPYPPHLTMESVGGSARPKDAEYGAYVSAHIRDLVERYRPDVLWNDISWPDETFHFEAGGLGELFNDYYTANPEGLVNDRWGDTHRDYRTSEYEASSDSETAGAWENCRGIGFSFGYNQIEGPDQYLTGLQLARHLTDVVSRGGNFLLNIGPRADGTIHELQRKALVDLGAWMVTAKPILAGRSTVQEPVDVTGVTGTDWVRVLTSTAGTYVFVDSTDGDTATLRLGDDVTLDGVSGVVDTASEADTVVVTLEPARTGPAVFVLS